MNKFKATLMLGIAFSVLYAAAPHNAKAQTAVGTGISNSDSRSGAASRSRSDASNQGVNTGVNTGVTLNQNSYGASPGNTGYVNERSTGDVTVRTTPTVYAPPVSGGNPCTLAVSGAVSVIGWGAAAGGTFVDEDCARRQKIAMMHNAGYTAAAREVMCNDKETYNAFKTAGSPCAIRTQFEAPIVAAQAQPAPPARPAGAVMAPASPPMVVAAFDPAQYPSMSDCLTAAYSVGAPAQRCAGKR